MKVVRVVLCAVGAAACAQEGPPIFDVHLHYMGAADFGPPPLAMCTPQAEWPAWDPATPYDSVYMSLLKNPPCDDPIWSPETDEGLLRGTIEVMERLNVFGVLSGYDE